MNFKGIPQRMPFFLLAHFKNPVCPKKPAIGVPYFCSHLPEIPLSSIFIGFYNKKLAGAVHWGILEIRN